MQLQKGCMSARGYQRAAEGATAWRELTVGVRLTRKNGAEKGAEWHV